MANLEGPSAAESMGNGSYTHERGAAEEHQAIAEAFSGHRFAEIYDRLAAMSGGVVSGQTTIEGKKRRPRGVRLVGG